MTTTTRIPAGAALIPVWLILLASCGGDSGETVDDADLPANRALYFPDQLVETAPQSFQARFETTRGDFVIEVTRSGPQRRRPSLTTGQERLLRRGALHRVIEASWRSSACMASRRYR